MMENMVLRLWVQAQSLIVTRRSDERGAVAGEYALLLFMIAVALIGAITAFRNQIAAAFAAATAALGGGGGGGGGG